jgi:hypothetical protein
VCVCVCGGGGGAGWRADTEAPLPHHITRGCDAPGGVATPKKGTFHEGNWLYTGVNVAPVSVETKKVVVPL